MQPRKKIVPKLDPHVATLVRRAYAALRFGDGPEIRGLKLEGVDFGDFHSNPRLIAGRLNINLAEFYRARRLIHSKCVIKPERVWRNSEKVRNHGSLHPA